MRLFGTDGIRGIAGRYPLDPDTLKEIGRAAADVLKKHSSRRTVIIGRDTRESGKTIVAALKKALGRESIEVWDLGVIPTPGVAHLTKQYPVLSGIVVSASHNPYLDNGIKFFGPQGTKLPDAVESEIEQLIRKNTGGPSGPARRRAARPGGAKAHPSLIKEYKQFLYESFPRKSFDLGGMRLTLDCANGATCRVAPELFSMLGAEVTALNITPDGKNINKESGSLHPQLLAASVKKNRSCCGIAFDGDGDRVIFIDENGVVRDGDFILTIASWFLKKEGRLLNNTLVTTVMANLGLFKAMDEHGITVLKTPVGDRYVYESMMKSGAVIGGEQSGHIIFKDFLPTGDGMLSALQIISIMKATGRPLSGLCSLMVKYPQILVNTHVAKKVPLESLPETSSRIRDTEKRLKGDGRVLVRYSGTENLLRVMVEGREKQAIETIAHEISDTAKREIENHA